jgi:hypothetical protein
VEGLRRVSNLNKRLTQHGRNSDKPSTSTRNNANVLPGVFALLALSVVSVVEVGNGVSERLDSGSRAILTTSHGDINVSRAIKAALDVVVDFRGSLTQVCPRMGILEVAMFVGLLGGPDDTGTRTGRVETGVGLVTFVGSAELPVHG